MKTKSRIKEKLEDKVLNYFFIISILIITIICVLPFLLVISSSFTDEYTLLKEGYKLFPSKWSTAAYRMVLSTETIFNAYKISIFITVVGTGLSLLVTAMMSYALSLPTFKSRNKIAFFVYFTMLFNGGLVSSYLLISKYLHMRNSIWVMIIPVLVNPWNMLLLRNFFASIPASIGEAARIDGANDMVIFFKIYLPISVPGLATIGLFYALSYWNEWFRAMLYLSKENLYPLQYLIMRIVRSADFVSQVAGTTDYGANLPTYTVRMATLVLAIGPIVLVYPFVQKYFIQGIMVGSVKG